MRKDKSKEYVQDKIRDVSYSVLVNRNSDRYNSPFKLQPWCKIYPKESMKDLLKIKLRNSGITVIDEKSSLVVKNISNCMLALRYLNPPNWWKKVIFMIDEGKHRNNEGILKIVKKRNKENKSNNKPKWTVERVKEVLKEN